MSAGTLAIIALSAGAGVAASSLMSGGASKPKVAAADNKKTAESLPQSSEAAKKNRKFAASVMAKDFQAPTLGTPGLLGI